LSAPRTGLDGCRILIVEDEMLVSMLMEDILLEFGCVVLGPAARLDAALKAAAEEDLDIALLDVNLAGQRSFPVADVLEKRGVPFIFVSGYGEHGLEAPHNNRPVIQKPFSPESMNAAILDCLNASVG
jgi:DNA-binding response OmpR family regulator